MIHFADPEQFLKPEGAKSMLFKRILIRILVGRFRHIPGYRYLFHFCLCLDRYLLGSKTLPRWVQRMPETMNTRYQPSLLMLSILLVLDPHPDLGEPFPRGPMRIRIRNTSYQGWKKPVFFKKTQPSGFFWVFLVFFGFFGFLGFFGFFCPDERFFGFFSVSRILLGACRL